MLTSGFSYVIGVYYVEFLEVFNETRATTAWISSLNYGTLCIIGEMQFSLSLAKQLQIVSRTLEQNTKVRAWTN